MAYPAISTLPAAPSRIGDAANFVAEGLAFLDAQVDFVNDCNAASTYLNALKFDVYDWGDLSPVGGSPAVSITTFINPAPSIPSVIGYDLALAIDNLLASMVAFVPQANDVGVWADGLSDPSAPVIVDPARPTISSVTATPLRNDGQIDFDSKAASFYGSARLFSTSMQEFANYVAAFGSGFEDWDSIAVVYDETDDWGFINE